MMVKPPAWAGGAAPVPCVKNKHCNQSTRRQFAGGYIFAPAVFNGTANHTLQKRQVKGTVLQLRKWQNSHN